MGARLFLKYVFPDVGKAPWERNHPIMKKSAWPVPEAAEQTRELQQRTRAIKQELSTGCTEARKVLARNAVTSWNHLTIAWSVREEAWNSSSRCVKIFLGSLLLKLVHYDAYIQVILSDQIDVLSVSAVF